jgi:hypothetical protein
MAVYLAGFFLRAVGAKTISEIRRLTESMVPPDLRVYHHSETLTSTTSTRTPVKTPLMGLTSLSRRRPSPLVDFRAAARWDSSFSSSHRLSLELRARPFGIKVSFLHLIALLILLALARRQHRLREAAGRRAASARTRRRSAWSGADGDRTRNLPHDFTTFLAFLTGAFYLLRECGPRFSLLIALSMAVVFVLTVLLRDRSERRGAKSGARSAA